MASNSLSDRNKLDLFADGFNTRLMDSFSFHGPLRLYHQPVRVLHADFHDGDDVNIATHAVISLQEDRANAYQGQLYAFRGADAAQDIVTFLANACRFEIYVRESKWWRFRMFFVNLFDKARKTMYAWGRFVVAYDQRRRNP